MEVVVVVVGAGPAGLATSVCLSRHSILHVVLEKEDICASLWKKRAYDRLKLHLAKEFCQLPFMPHGPNAPVFMSKDLFIEYVDNYVTRFDIRPKYGRTVVAATYDETTNRWRVEAKNSMSEETEIYWSEFVVVATGENGEGYVPAVKGLETFGGEVVHSSKYKTGLIYKDKEVLVVGSGNSGMEISFDLCEFGARPTIVVRSPRHVVTKEAIYMGMSLLKYLPMKIVDSFVTTLSRLMYGDLSKHGLFRPPQGPFYTKFVTGKSPIIDVGTIQKIQAGDIRVVPGIVSINGSNVKFENGFEQDFDVIVFATGYKSLVCKWLKTANASWMGCDKNYEYMMTEEGRPKTPPPNHWKGEKNLYCAGFSGKGIAGAAEDAKAVADDINKLLLATTK